MPTDPAHAVLRDFENVIWLTILFGIVLFGVWRLFFRPSSELATEGGIEVAPLPEKGIPVAHFSLADLFFLPLILLKYSVTLQLLAGNLFALPVKAAEEAGLVDAAVDAAQLTDPVPLKMSTELILLDMSINIFLIAMIILMIQWVGRRNVDTVFGLRRIKSLRILLWVVVGAFVATPLVILTSHGMPQLFEGIFGKEIEEQAAVQSMRESTSLGLKILLVINACLVAPVIEELVFRGYCYGVMKRFTGAMFAAFVTSALFAVAHQSILALLPLFGFALFLNLFYESSRSIWVPMGVHSVFNIVNVALILSGVGGEG
ncbi:MAG: CPBP family intramembrane metalloprotease [Verrucomicrobiae bacterium]|nr:CPBP family intramembrane metalloprotease [Verrucomicrobiae bacterium]